MASPAFEEIAETFEFLDDWEDRYRHVIEIGRAMPPLEEALKVPATKVEGCASQVWLVPRVEDGRFDFAGDSDAMIVKGLIAVLHALYAGRAGGGGAADRRGRRARPAGARRASLVAAVERAAGDGEAHPERGGDGRVTVQARARAGARSP